MIKYISIFVLLAILTSCGADNFAETKAKSFSFSYDMDKYVNEIELLNPNTFVKEESNTYSSINEANPYSFGLQFSSNLINDVISYPTTISARVRKEEVNSETTLVLTCIEGDEVIAWEAVKIDSTYVHEPNQWVNFSYTGLSLPENTPKNATIKVFFWSVDGKKVDIDDFKLEIEA